MNGEDIRLDLAGLGTDDIVRDFGGLGKAVRLTRLPDDPLPSVLTETFRVPLVAGAERCLYIRANFEDGHVAWTSPIYLKRI